MVKHFNLDTKIIFFFNKDNKDYIKVALFTILL